MELEIIMELTKDSTNHKLVKIEQIANIYNSYH